MGPQWGDSAYQLSLRDMSFGFLPGPSQVQVCSCLAPLAAIKVALAANFENGPGGASEPESRFEGPAASLHFHEPSVAVDRDTAGPPAVRATVTEPPLTEGASPYSVARQSQWRLGTGGQLRTVSRMCRQ